MMGSLSPLQASVVGQNPGLKKAVRCPADYPPAIVHFPHSQAARQNDWPAMAKAYQLILGSGSVNSSSKKLEHEMEK
jgi:hypothetical protein